MLPDPRAHEVCAHDDPESQLRRRKHAQQQLDQRAPGVGYQLDRAKNSSGARRHAERCDFGIVEGDETPGLSDGSSDGKRDRTGRVVIAEAAEKEHERPPAAYQLKPTFDAEQRERCGDGPREENLVGRKVRPGSNSMSRSSSRNHAAASTLAGTATIDAAIPTTRRTAPTTMRIRRHRRRTVYRRG